MPPKSTIGMALAAYKLWRRLPPAQKRMVLDQARDPRPQGCCCCGGARQEPQKAP